MKKTIIALLIMPFLTVLAKADISDANVTIGVGGAQYVSGATVRETQDGSGGGSSTAKGSDKESGVFQASTGYVFAEVGVDRFNVGISLTMSDMSTPNATNTKNGSTNTVQVDFTDILTAYATIDVIGGFYLKAGAVSGDIITNESVNTSSQSGSTVGDQSLEGTVAGLGFKHTLDTGLQLRSEILYGSYDNFSVTDTSNDTYAVSGMESLQANVAVAYAF